MILGRTLIFGQKHEKRQSKALLAEMSSLKQALSELRIALEKREHILESIGSGHANG